MARDTASGVGISRRDVLKTGRAVVGAFDLELPRGAGDAKAAALDMFSTAKVCRKAFLGTEIVLGALEHPWTATIEAIIPLFAVPTGAKIKKQSEAECAVSMPFRLDADAPEPDVLGPPCSTLGKQAKLRRSTRPTTLRTAPAPRKTTTGRSAAL